MWRYEKRLQYPVKISQTNPKLAQYIISQYGGPDGESAAAMRYLSQRYAMPYEKGKAIMTDIGSEASEMFLRNLTIYLFDFPIFVVIHPHSQSLQIQAQEKSVFPQ